MQGTAVTGDTLESDKKALLNLKIFLEEHNRVNQGGYSEWNKSQTLSPCAWPGITCSGGRVTGVNLSSSEISGDIFGNFSTLTALNHLDLSSNTIGGRLPTDLGQCHGLKVLNLSHNIIGLNATPTFEQNRRNDRVTVASGECLAMRRWIPADYPPFSFVYTLLTRKNCLSLWDRLLRGYGIFALCVGGVRTFQMSGYVQLSSNQLSGEVPPDIGKMLKVSMLNLGINGFYGDLPPEIGQMPLAALNISQNKFSGEIPREIGNIKCLRDLDLSNNNFSGDFPTELNNLNELSKFNVSFNPYITGVIPATGQLATFEKESFLGDPLLGLPSFTNNSADHSPTINDEKKSKKKPAKRDSILVFLALVVVFFFLIGFCGGLFLFDRLWPSKRLY
ncbi:probable LRR receptor-like serine/threonine-protein kinase At1g74360 isoform X2 [Rhododendron vialii]|uniref:probable LRR receptor-like serine/threonine-protein kinase At1g74360 isoform X2 n=1 Tax=Rhododendron vialii TaxID=182163 RepID=UPI00265EBC13|nr:probable LRR receptor-like serine/threonine-protein kinase At1g74360 isoform X2 [Rhododendron vialii]XP_058194931.1 probable LRR receptor-like serine/threonine-protein kinase At1g74360 isoform X2 [Rhododendron vialii]